MLRLLPVFLVLTSPKPQQKKFGELQLILNCAMSLCQDIKSIIKF